MLGHTDTHTWVWWRETSGKNVALEAMAVGYLVLLWPLHLGLKAVFRWWSILRDSYRAPKGDRRKQTWTNS